MTDKDIRRAVLLVMNKRRKDSRHEHEIRMHLRQIENALSDEGCDVEDERVMQAVDYLTEAKMLKRTKETKTIKPLATRLRSSSRFSPARSSIKHTNYFYTLAIKAIDELDGETEYSKKPFEPFQTIHVTTINAPVIIGSNNIVKNNVTLFAQLDELRQAISEAEDMSVETRQDIAGDIESLKQQLAKPNPDNAVVGCLWQNIGRGADLAGLAGLAVEIAKGIAAITGNPVG